MGTKEQYSRLDDLRNLGKYIEKVAEGDDDSGVSLIGKAYFASCSAVNRRQSNLDQDRELVRIFAKNIRAVIDNSNGIVEQIEEGARDFANTC